MNTDKSITDDVRQDDPTSRDVSKDSNVVTHLMSTSMKRKYRSVSPARSSASVPSLVVAGVKTTKEARGCQQTPASVDVVASMHSYAMPSNIRRSTVLTATHPAAAATSCAEENEVTDNESSAAETVRRPVRFLCLSRKVNFFVV